MSPSASAALPLTIKAESASAAINGSAGASVAEQAQRERGHLPNLRVAIAEPGDERLDTLAKSDPPNRQRRPPTHSGFIVIEQAQQIRPG